MNSKYTPSESVYLHAIEYELGELRDLESVREFADDSSMLEVYRVRGLNTFSETKLSASEFARGVAERTLKKARIDPAEVDVVLYATDFLMTGAMFSRPEINLLLNDLGLTNAFPIGISLGACTNFAPAIQLAASLLRTGQARNVLLLIVEKLDPAMSRLMDLGIAILSDAAVACLISSQPGDYQVLGVGRSSSPAVQRISLEQNSRDYFAATGMGIKRAVDDVLQPYGGSRDAVARIFTNNYVTHVVKAFVKYAGFGLDKCYFENIPRFAHAFSADTLINLTDYTRSHPFAGGERVALLGTAPTSFGAVLLEARAGLS